MNLVTDPWLPVTNSQNQLCYVNLNQLFDQPDEWLDLVLRPHERVSIMRFLICLVQAALGKLEEDDWDDALDILPGKSLYYLQNWQGNFNLFDSKKPFLQIAELEPFNKEPTYTTKLQFSLATGSNSTLFDHGCINPIKEISPRQMEISALVVSILTFNNFSLGGLYPQAKWKNKVTSKSGVKDAPCASQSMLHCFVRRDTIVKTLHANTLTIQQLEDRYGAYIGVPVWELFPDSPDDKKAVFNATQTYMGRLVPLSRWLKLLPDKKTMLMGEGFVYPVHPEFVETTGVMVVNKQKDAIDILGCKTATPWRELCALITKRKGQTFGGPAAIENQSKLGGYDLQVLALKREQASVLDGFESVLHVPSYFTNSDEIRAAYNDGIKKAEMMAFKLDEAIQIYISTLMPQMIEIVRKGINKQPLSKHESEKYRSIKNRVKEKYLTHYWTLVEKQRHLLMQYISLLGTESDRAREDSKKAWLNAIISAADETYRTLCNQDSPRQLRAYVAGWQILHQSKSARQEAA